MSAAGLVVLCVILALWYPANFAVELLMTFPSLGMRGPLAAVELLAHGLVAALCVAAGRSLWSRTVHGPALARLALVGAALVSVQSLYWSVLPAQTKPGDELPLAALAIAHAGAWLLFLRRVAPLRDAALPLSLTRR